MIFRAPRYRTLSAGAVVLALAAFAAGCGGSSTSSSGSGGSGSASTASTLVIANAVKVDTLDPEANSVNESIWLDQNLYSRLLQPNATGTGLLPDLASSWTIAKNGLTYTFHLRPDAKFSNGTPVTASDVVYSIERSRKFAGGWGFLLTPVKTITAPDAHTVVITLSQPHAPLLADLAMYAYSVVPEKPGQVRGQQVLPAPGGQRAVHGHFVQPGQRGRPGAQPALLRDQAEDQQGQDHDRAERQHPGADAAEQEGGHHREPAGQPGQPDRQDTRT